MYFPKLQPFRFYQSRQKNHAAKEKPVVTATTGFPHFGGAEGGRTPVRKEIYGSIYGCSLSTGFPSRQAGKQADGTVADECVTSRTALGRSRAPHKMMPRAGPVVVPGRTAA